MLRYLYHDDETRVILLYVEDIKSGRKFLEAAEQITQKKPVVALKSGRTEAAPAPRLHTQAP
jgi:acyl-CoA synthetase (NDP forming)